MQWMSISNDIISGTEKKGVLEGVSDLECHKAKMRNHCPAFSIKAQVNLNYGT